MQKVRVISKMSWTLCCLLILGGCAPFGLFKKKPVPVNYQHLSTTMDVIRKTAIEENFQKIAILDFSDKDGRPTPYSQSFNEQLNKKALQQKGESYQFVQPGKFKTVLKKLKIDDIGFMQSADIKRLTAQIPDLHAIVTGTINLKDGPSVIFFKSNGEILKWQKGISESVSKIGREIKKHAIEPLALSPFYAVSDGKPNAFSKYLTAKISSKLGKLKVQLTNIEDIPKIFEQWKLQMKGITDENSAVQVGKLANAKSMLIGNVAGSLSSSWEVNVRLVDVEKGTTFWADNFVNLEKGVIQTYLPFELTDQDTSLLKDSEKQLIHQMIGDESLSRTEKNYYINSIVTTAQIRRNLESDPETPYLTELAKQLEQFRVDIEEKERQKLEAERFRAKNEIIAERKKLQQELEAIRQKWLKNFDEEYMSLTNGFVKLKKLIDDSNWNDQLSLIISQLNNILNELDELKRKRTEMTAKKY